MKTSKRCRHCNLIVVRAEDLPSAARWFGPRAWVHQFTGERACKQTYASPRRQSKPLKPGEMF